MFDIALTMFCGCWHPENKPKTPAKPSGVQTHGQTDCKSETESTTEVNGNLTTEVWLRRDKTRKRKTEMSDNQLQWKATSNQFTQDLREKLKGLVEDEESAFFVAETERSRARKEGIFFKKEKEQEKSTWKDVLEAAKKQMRAHGWATRVDGQFGPGAYSADMEKKVVSTLRNVYGKQVGVIVFNFAWVHSCMCQSLSISMFCTETAWAIQVIQSIQSSICR